MEILECKFIIKLFQLEFFATFLLFFILFQNLSTKPLLNKKVIVSGSHFAALKLLFFTHKDSALFLDRPLCYYLVDDLFLSFLIQSMLVIFNFKFKFFWMFLLFTSLFIGILYQFREEAYFSIFDLLFDIGFMNHFQSQSKYLAYLWAVILSLNGPEDHCEPN